MMITMISANEIFVGFHDVKLNSMDAGNTGKSLSGHCCGFAFTPCLTSECPPEIMQSYFGHQCCNGEVPLVPFSRK